MLAEQLFQTLITIAAKFNLKLKQFNAINAFINAKLNKEIYIKMLLGYTKLRTILKLQKALYSLQKLLLL
jgi:hypothetical protein